MAYPKPKVSVKYPVATHGAQTPRVVVIHDTESHDAAGIRDIMGIAAFWQAQGQGLGSHFIIDREGHIGQGAPGNVVTYAVAGHNTGCIHIELIGFARWTPKVWLARRKQFAQTKRLVAYLCDHWNIPAVYSTSHGVCRHRDFHAGHTDPGVGYPFKRMMYGVRRLLAG